MKNYVVEFIGTFFLVLVIGLTVLAPSAALPPLAIGSILMVMVYAGGHISGGHYNPAVTLAVWLRGKCATRDLAPYIIAQVAAALLAAVVVRYCKPQASPSPAPPDYVRAMLIEFLFTFALCYVVLNTATSKKNAGNSYYGLAIGFTVLAGAFAGGPISGGAYNPAVAVGLTALGLSAIENIWIFLVGNLAGAALAAFVYRFVNPDELTG